MITEAEREESLSGICSGSSTERLWSSTAQNRAEFAHYQFADSANGDSCMRRAEKNRTFEVKNGCESATRSAA